MFQPPTAQSKIREWKIPLEARSSLRAVHEHGARAGSGLR
jgi:hypothetical protein